MVSNESFEVITVPLVEAVIEVRFPGDADIERRRGEFQRAVRLDHPDLLVPRVAVGDSVAMRPYVFASSDRSQAVMLSINLLGYLVRAYPGWHAFRHAFLGHWERLTSLVPIQRATRIAVRYVNRFDGPLAGVVRKTDGSPFLAPLSTSAFQHEGSTHLRTLLGNVAHVQVRWDAAADTGLVLDLDVARDGLGDLSAIESVLDSLHADVEELFVAAVEPAFSARLLSTVEEEQ